MKKAQIKCIELVNNVVSITHASFVQILKSNILFYLEGLGPTVKTIS